MAEFEQSAAPPSELERGKLLKFLDAFQEAEPLLHNITGEVFIQTLSPKRFKRFEALIDSFPFRSESPWGFRLWAELTEPKRRKWMEEVEEKSRRFVPRRKYFVLANRPATHLAPGSSAIGSAFLVLASKGEKGRIRFSGFSSGFLIDGAMVNTFSHSPDVFANSALKQAA